MERPGSCPIMKLRNVDDSSFQSSSNQKIQVPSICRCCRSPDSVFAINSSALHKPVDILCRRRSGQSAPRSEDESAARREHFDGFAACFLDVLHGSLLQDSAGIDRTKKCSSSRARFLGNGLVALVIELEDFGACLDHPADDFRGVAAYMVSQEEIVILQSTHNLLAVGETVFVVHRR